MSRTFFRLMVLALFLAGSVLPGHAETFTVFGPSQFETGAGKPVAETLSFSSPLAGSACTLIIENGDAQGQNRVSTATVTLNGRQVAGPSDFNQQADRIEKVISVDFFNELSVKLGGKPGSLITLSMIAEGDISAPAPSVSLDANPVAIDAGETSLLSWRATDANGVLIEPEIGPVAASGTTTVSPAATTTYTISATGAGGTASASATVTVLQSKPTVRIVAEPTAVTLGESATLRWSTTGALGCEIDNGIGSVAPAGSSTVSPRQTTNFTITASGPGGTASAEILLTVSQPLSPIGLSFDSLNGAPLNGTTVDASRISIGGSVASTASSEVGVLVNDVLAQVAGSRFVANHVPLAPGWNTITVRATDGEGNKGQISANVYSGAASEYVLLSSNQESGLAPPDVTFEADTFLANPITGASLTCSGPSTPDITQASPTEYSAALTQEGLYICTVEMTDSAGNAYEDSVAVNAVSKAALDGLLQAKWSGMKEAMAAGDVEAAVGYFTESSRNSYRQQFTLLSKALPRIVAEMGAATLLRVEGDRAVYDLRTVRNGATYSFQLLFVRNGDGLWRIKNF